MLKSIVRNPVFRFFASLKMAVVSLLLLAAVLAVGTVAESSFGMRGAHLLVYGTAWFGGVLFLLGLNVFCAALSRYPWKRSQTGFVVTHLGIIVVLIGSVITQRWGVDGNLPIREGGEDNQVLLNDLRLTLIDEDTRRRLTIPVPESHKSTSGDLLNIAFTKHSRLLLDRFYPRLVFETSVKPALLGVPALQLKLYNSRFTVQEWILAQRPDGPTELNLGPAVIEFSRASNAEMERAWQASPGSIPPPKSKRGYLNIRYQNRDYRLSVDDYFGHWTKVQGSPLDLKVEKFYSYAVVEGKNLVNKSEELTNPAVQLAVKAGGREERHTVFAFFPEFSTMHKGEKKESALGLDIKLEIGKTEEQGRGKLQFLQSHDGKSLYYRVLRRSGKLNAHGKVKKGENVVTGWMDLQFQVVEWLPSAVQSTEPRAVDYITGGSQAYLQGAHFKMTARDQGSVASDFWLIEGAPIQLSLDGSRTTFYLDKEKLILPFMIHLDKFTLGTDPGTSKAASYQSKVIVKDKIQGVELPALISMNEPLQYAGFTFYQASYQMEEGQPPVSVLAVNRDPGRWIKYLGSLLVCLGIMLMFYMNPQYWDVVLPKSKGAK